MLPPPDPPIIQAMKKGYSVTGWTEVQLNHKPYWGIGNLDVDPYVDGGSISPSPNIDDGGSISPDGTRLLMFVDYFNPSIKVLEVSDFNTGTQTDLINSFHLPAYLDKGDGTAGTNTIRTAFWHPIDLNIIFADIYRLDLLKTSKEKMLNSDDMSFGQPLPDGKWIPVFSPRTNSTYLQSLVNPRKKLKVNWPMGYITVSPDGSIVQGLIYSSTGSFIVFNDFATHRQIGKVNRAYFDKAKGWNVKLYGITRWLPNSSELLVNGLVGNWKHRGVWKVSISGSISLFAEDVILVASSDNGKHFLFYTGEKYYLVHLK